MIGRADATSCARSAAAVTAILGAPHRAFTLKQMRRGEWLRAPCAGTIGDRARAGAEGSYAPDPDMTHAALAESGDPRRNKRWLIS